MQLIEKANEYSLPVCMAFIDYEKAFNLVEHHGIMDALDKHQVHKTYIEMLTSCTVAAHPKLDYKMKIVGSSQ